MKKRLLAMMMAIVMVMTLLPTSALAAGGDTGLQEGQVRATKALVLDNENKPAVDADGYYTVQITVQGKPKQAENGSNADVVLVVDNSGSMDSSVGEPCNTPKEKFEKHYAVLWYSYTCPTCGAKYTSSLAGFLWDERPERCTGQKGKTPRIDAAKAVGKEFANSILTTGTGNRLAVIGFAHHKDNGGVDEEALTVSQDLTDNLTEINKQIDQMKADGGTNYTAALAKAQEYLNGRSDSDKATRPGYVIFISDGAPGLSGKSLNDPQWNGSDQIQQLKTAGITVYTVGIALEADAADYLKSMASDKQDEHFINVSTTKYKDEMSKILQTWATKINSIPAGRNATITDVVNTDDFVYEMVGTPSNVTNVNGTVTWNIGDITEEAQIIQFKVKPQDGKYGKLYTNNSVTLSYTNCEGQKQQIQDTKDMATEPQIGNPYIEITNPARAYTVEYYYDDVKGAAPTGAPTSGTANVGDTVTISAGDNADATHFPKQTTVGTENYAFDEGVANVLNTTIVEDATKNVLKVHYAKDENGDGTPDYKEKKYTITYAEGTTDTVSGMPAEVIGVLAGTEQTVSSEKPTREGYTFSGWQAPEGVTVTDNKFTMPEKNVTFTAQWTANDVTIIFDANGGAWAADVAGYTMNADKTKASKTYKPSDVVTKIPTDPVQAGKAFNGWYIMVSGKKEPVVWTSFIKAQLIHQHGGVIYADWTGAAPAGQCTYTTRQHYINEKGVEELAVNIMVQSAEKGTKISDLIKHLENNQTYYGQNYFYDRTKTTVNGDAYNAETMTLDTDGKAIDLYYYLDAWNDENDTLTGGDNIPDCQQAVVNFLADPNGSVGKGDEKTTQVFTLKKGADDKYSKSVTPANVTPMPKENFVFDIWTKDNGETGVNPFVAQTLNGGDKVTYTAHFAADKIGPKNEPDNIPDKYQAVVTYKVVGGTWKDGKTDDQVQVFTLKTKNKETGVWEDVTPAPTLGNTIPTGMISSYSRTASQSWDKDITKDTKVTENVTYTYTFTKGSSGGGSSGGGGGRKPTVDIPDDVPTGLNGDDHFAYIVGYPDGNVNPGGNITRAEVATIFFRLLTEDVRTANSTQSNSLSDVSRGQWFNHAISTLSSMGIVKGNPDGTFDPDAPITRAEFAAIAARFDDKNTNNTSNFSDIASHWAKDEIGVAANKGWINGYPDSTFRPDQYITRAEAMTLVNRVLNRLPEKSEDLLDDMIKWPDNADASVWYYLAVQEATNSHDYSDKSDADKYEKWTKLRENRDWTELEK